MNIIGPWSRDYDLPIMERVENADVTHFPSSFICAEIGDAITSSLEFEKDHILDIYKYKVIRNGIPSILNHITRKYNRIFKEI